MFKNVTPDVRNQVDDFDCDSDDDSDDSDDETFVDRLKEIADNTVSRQDRYLQRPHDSLFNDIKYCEYYEKYTIAKQPPKTQTITLWKDQVPGKECYVYHKMKTEFILYPII